MRHEIRRETTGRRFREKNLRERRQAGEMAMRIARDSSRVAWGERESKHRSAKGRAAMVVATFATLLIFCGSLSFADQSTAKLPVSLAWTRWTNEECYAVLNSSPWAYGIFSIDSDNPNLRAIIGRSSRKFAEGTIQLRSALPVREALLRQLQIDQKYDVMTAQQKLAFDQQFPVEMSENASDPILLYIEHDGQNNETVDVGSGISMSHTRPSPAREVALKLTDGTLVMPIKTEAIQNDEDQNKYLYSFPRTIVGKPVLSADDQALNFVFGRTLEGGKRIRPIQYPNKFRALVGEREIHKGVSFLTVDLMYNGKLEY
jgi:hypothetical protein